MAIRDVNLLPDKKNSKWIQIMKSHKVWEDITSHVNYTIASKTKDKSPEKAYNISGESDDQLISSPFYK